MTDEKEDEKEHEKEEKYVEKWDVHEKHHGDPFPSIGWGLAFILLAIIFWGRNTYPDVFTGSWWGWVFLGVGIIVLLLNFARWFVPEYRRSLEGPVILSIFLICIGLYGIGELGDFLFPLLLVVIGLVIIAHAVARRR